MPASWFDQLNEGVNKLTKRKKPSGDEKFLGENVYSQ